MDPLIAGSDSDDHDEAGDKAKIYDTGTMNIVITDDVRPDRNIAEVFLLSLALYNGVDSFILKSDSSVGMLLGPLWELAWGITLLTGSILAIVGIYWRGKGLTAASLMQIGYAAFAPASLGRGVALIQLGQGSSGIVLTGFAAICLIRIVQLEMRVRKRYPACVKPVMKRWVRRRGK